MLYSNRKLQSLNEEFHEASTSSVLNWVFGNHKHVVASSHFGPNEAVLLHHIHLIKPDLPIICVDHGYNTNETYQLTEKLIRQLELNVKFYTPRVTSKRREAIFNGVPKVQSEAAHQAFVNEVKLEPFSRAFSEHRPEIWLTSIRKDQTDHREDLDIFTEDRRFNCVKVAPFFYWSKFDMDDYLREFGLPNINDYYDPTKVVEHRECGLHLSN